MSDASPGEDGNWPWTRRFADFLTRSRGYVYVVVIAALALDIGYWAFSNLLNLLGASWVKPWVESSETAAAIGLAIGTLALASAGLLQARAAGIQLNLAARQADRERTQIQLARVQMTPNLDFQVLQPAESPTIQDTIRLGEGEWYIRTRLRNLGPGAAVDIQVTAFDWWINQSDLDAELTKLAAGGSLKGAILTEPGMMPRDIVNVPFALMAGEFRDFGIQFIVPPLPEKTTSLVQQLVVVAWTRNMEGQEVLPRKLGLRLQHAFPTGTALVGGQPGRMMIWRWLTEPEIARIPGIPSIRTSFRSGLGLAATLAAASQKAD
ncbi:MAG: hypothetical protein WBW47_07545 [Thermoplasmata archaeon]